MPSLWRVCQHKCYIKQAKKKKRRVGRYVEDCNIILFSCVERPLMMRTRRSFELKIVPKNLFFDFLNEVAVNENGFECSVGVLFHSLLHSQKINASKDFFPIIQILGRK